MLHRIANHETLSSVVNALPLGLFWKDRNSVYLGGNSHTAMHAGLPDAAALVGLTDYDLFAREQADAIRADDRQVIETGVPKLGIIESVTTPSGIRWLELYKVPLRDPSDQIIGVVGTFRDITDRVQLQEERTQLIAQLTTALDAAEEANRAKSRFLANMSHELRTPLNAIIGYSEMLEETDASREATADLQRIQRAGRHLLALVDDVLDLAKLESGPTELVVGPIWVSRLIDDAKDFITPAAVKNGTTITFDEACPECVVRADETKLRQCLLSLLSNAAKFTENGEIHVTLRRRDATSVEIEVRDTGVGMTEAHVDQLFQPFMHADSSIACRVGGTGLGLVITRSLMLHMGGDIRAESRLGAGSKFTLTIPAECSPVVNENDGCQSIVGERLALAL
ncbi:MAG: PAS domain-containing protein [Hyphomonadaceae bacterium]|nr:PAS domain-containing protein [Hyphomonadaceae bacterium]